MSDFRNPVISSDGVDHGDPFVLKYLDCYYLYHTGHNFTADTPPRGISVYRSHDLVDWDFHGNALEPRGRDHWAQTDLWGPEVLYDEGTFYMYCAATPLKGDGAGDDDGRRLGIARSESPLGPFEWDDEPFIDEWSIDGHPFRDEDGLLWLFYNIRNDRTRHASGAVGSGNVVDRLVTPLRLAGEPIPVTFPTEPWEGTRAGDWFWNEGAWVLKRRGRYYQMFSGGSFTDDTYAIGIAEAESPLGPWKKHPRNPIFKGGAKILGPGHHSVVHGPDGATLYAVYHGYVPGDPGRKIHIDRIWWCGDRPVIGSPLQGPPSRPTESAQPRPPKALYDPSIRTWRADFWVRGPTVTVAGAPIRLTPSSWHRIQAAQREETVEIWVDGVFHFRDRSHREPRFESEGELAAEIVTSSLDEDVVHELAPGGSHSWAWGGTGPLEVSLSVRGIARLVVGEASHELAGPPGDFRPVRIAFASGADEITVVAGPDGATVTDLYAVARAE